MSVLVYFRVWHQHPILNARKVVGLLAVAHYVFIGALSRVSSVSGMGDRNAISQVSAELNAWFLD